jgi:hypothetical protein
VYLANMEAVINKHIFSAPVPRVKRRVKTFRRKWENIIKMVRRSNGVISVISECITWIDLA